MMAQINHYCPTCWRWNVLTLTIPDALPMSESVAKRFNCELCGAGIIMTGDKLAWLEGNPTVRVDLMVGGSK